MQHSAHVFLKELVENAIDHSGREYALIAAMRRPHGYNLKKDEIYECEQPFALWCKNYPVIEVMVGDSVAGIPHSLLKEFQRKHPTPPEKLKNASVNTRVLAWAFDKWSSRSQSDSKRGTRGLYRAERVVRKYDGCITLRSEYQAMWVLNVERPTQQTTFINKDYQEFPELLFMRDSPLFRPKNYLPGS